MLAPLEVPTAALALLQSDLLLTGLGLSLNTLPEISPEVLTQPCIASVAVPRPTAFKNSRRVQYRMLMIICSCFCLAYVGIGYLQLKNFLRPAGNLSLLTHPNRPNPDYLFAIGDNK